VQGLRRGRLGVLAIVFFVIAAVAPLGSVIGGSPVIFAAVGVTTPLMYLIVGVLFAVFSVGFVAMSRHVTNAAGFVAFVAKGLGSRFGGALAGVAIVGYLALVSGLWAIIGGIAESTFAELGLQLPGWLWWLVGLAIVTALCYAGIDVSLRVLGVLVILEIVTLLIVAFAVLLAGGATGAVNAAAFNPANIVPTGAGIAILFAATCYTGFEATVVFSEEAREPRKTIPRAAYIAIAVIAVFYAFVTWALSNAFPTADVQAQAQELGSGFVFVAAEVFAGPWLSTTLGILMLTSSLAMFIGFHNLFARYLFSLGRSGLLPAVFARTSEKGTPRVAVLIFSAAVLVVVGIFLLSGADLLSVVYPWLTALGTVALIVVLLFASIAIIAFFVGQRVGRGHLWQTKLAPALAGLGFLGVLVLAVLNYDALLGGAGDAARWLLLVIPVAFVLGLARAAQRRRAGRDLAFEDSPL